MLLQPDMPYTEFPPDLRLQQFVECYWCVKSATQLNSFRPVFPDACSDIIFNFSAPLLYEEHGKISCNQFQSFYVGIQTAPIFTKAGGPTDLLGVRFKNQGAWRFLRRPLAEFSNRTASLKELDEGDLHNLTEQLAFLSVSERIKIIELRLLARLGNEPGWDMADQFFSSPSGSIQGFCRANNLSERTLERRSRERIGVSPKIYQRIVRFRKASGKLSGFDGSLMEFAWDMGYYDHAHLAKDFREFGHFLPSSLMH
ncbi:MULTISPECIES: helix-turn-helix transcriptional regulator [unclassified Imperialibacter]|uniref:helix-turn-helix transcriptional regulator n=1 Tax=unclassified Imperialibacter TaxID=2629706 RepID=UPI00125631DD|nr:MULTISPECIES: helix-turn-helix transcriptional regulator [unclassified Imperialibacter]CAD5270291.1 putative Helix-turn-helix domain-containing protein [Imperialibacter sp. 89]CAD5298118.1 putative Helix-turn-helix domain-containing protein [Imperialibacter sp. 75]VVT34295.1 putative Helix-turn-helix domain-containing protein [Imperialibacter sp. EC-SDR9]